MKWVPKPQQPSKTLNETSHKVAKETIPAETPLHANMSLSTNPTIKERARALQIQLFGLQNYPNSLNELSVQEYTTTR